MEINGVKLYGVGVYECTQKDGTFDGYTVGALWGRKTAAGNERRDFSALARMIESAGLSTIAAATFNDYTRLYPSKDSAIIAAAGFVKRFKIEAAGLLEKEAARYAEIKAAADKAKNAPKADGKTDADADGKTDGKGKSKRTTADKIKSALKGEKSDIAKANALISALALINKDAADAAAGIVAAGIEAQAAALSKAADAAAAKNAVIADIEGKAQAAADAVRGKAIAAAAKK